MQFLEKIRQFGIDESLPEWKKERIKASNVLGVVALFMNIPFALAFYMLYPAIAFLPVSAIVLSGVYFVLVANNYYSTARVMLSTFGSTMVICFIHLAILKPGEELILSLFSMQLILSLCPLILFDHRERKELFTVYGLHLLCFLIVIYGEGFNHWNYDTSDFRSGTLYQMGQFSSVFLLILLIYFIFNNIKTASEKQESIIVEMKQKQNDLEKNSEELNEYIDEVKKARLEDERRQWIAKGTSEIDKILRSDLSIHELQDALIKTVVQYTNSNQGGLFIFQDDEESDPHLLLTSCYAFDRKKFLEKRIEIGQGLVGQAYLEAELTMLTEIPENYVNITSGLGDANPRCLIIVPLIYNDKVQGLLELAAFKTYESHHVQYLKEAAASLASYIITMKTNQRTNKLLEEFQEQTETMRAQEEEMRQNFEELMATQEQMNRLKTEEEQKYQQLLKAYEELKAQTT